MFWKFNKKFIDDMVLFSWVAFISRKAKKFSFSATLNEGISPEIIFENIEDIYLEIFNILNFKIPFGTFISAISPTDFPNNPLPIGELTDIFPEAKSASPSATII